MTSAERKRGEAAGLRLNLHVVKKPKNAPADAWIEVTDGQGSSLVFKPDIKARDNKNAQLANAPAQNLRSKARNRQNYTSDKNDDTSPEITYSENLTNNTQNLLEIEKQSIESRLKKLKAFVDTNGSLGLDDFHRRLFPEIYSASRSADNGIDISTDAPEHLVLPEKAPHLWTDARRDATEKGVELTPPQFYMKIYGHLVESGFSKANLRALDNQLLDAIENWRRAGKPLPQGFELPTLKEQNDRRVTDLREGRVPLGDFTHREASRLLMAKHRRKESTRD